MTPSFLLVSVAERDWFDQESELRTHIEFYVDLPSNKELQSRRDEINVHNPNCTNPDAFEHTTVTPDIASDVMQLMSHCQSLVAASITELRKIAQCTQKSAFGKEKKELEEKLTFERLDHLCTFNMYCGAL